MNIDWSNPTYVTSQIFITLAFLLLGLTYLVKGRLKILIIVLLSYVAFIVGYSLLSAWVGLWMSIIMMACNITSYLIDRRRKRKDKITGLDWAMLALWTSVMLTATIIVQDGFLSWFAFFASFAFMYSLWQKNVLVYRLLGFVVGICWIVYNLTIANVMGIVSEAVLLTAVLLGLVIYIKKEREKKTANSSANSSTKAS